MSRYPSEARVFVYPFSRQEEGPEVIIGRPEVSVFLVLPPDAVEILDLLKEGNTVGETRDLYQKKYGEIPDMDDFLELLQRKGLISSQSAARAEEPRDVRQPAPVRSHFASISPSAARLFFGRTALRFYALLIGAALTAAALQPGLLPGPSALYFAEHQAMRATLLFVLSYVALFAHEMGHLVAARALGVGARIGFGHRLWFLVAETDLSGLWSVPRRARYLPLLAGPLIDAVSAALLILVTFAVVRDWLPMSLLTFQFLQALVFLYVMRIAWQCFFFVRTDFYYAIANYWSCRNLLGDTEAYLRALAGRIGLLRPVERPSIPPAELRVVRFYAPIWILGRILAIGLLIFATIPVAFKYLQGMAATFRLGPVADKHQWIDFWVLTTISIGPLVIGLVWWLVSLGKEWRRNRGAAANPA